MRKFFYTFAFILCALMTLQAETMVVATYNLRNANGSDSTNGNGWLVGSEMCIRDNAIPTSPRSYSFTGSISLEPKRANIRNCRT